MPDTSILIIVNSQSKKGVDLKRKKCVTFVDCNKADQEVVTKWVYLTLKRAGVIASVQACEAVANYCLCDMARVSVEVEKLISLGQSQIGIEEVDDLVYKDADYRIYEMTNAITRKNYSQFCEIMADLKLKGLDENAILSSLLSYFKNALIIVTSDKSDAALADMLKIKEYGVKKTAEQARAMGNQRLTEYVNCLYSQISDIKSGKLTPVGALNCAVSTIFFK